jgi:hypothetical protein
LGGLGIIVDRGLSGSQAMLANEGRFRIGGKVVSPRSFAPDASGGCHPSGGGGLVRTHFRCALYLDLPSRSSTMAKAWMDRRAMGPPHRMQRNFLGLRCRVREVRRGGFMVLGMRDHRSWWTWRPDKADRMAITTQATKAIQDAVLRTSFMPFCWLVQGARQRGRGCRVYTSRPGAFRAGLQGASLLSGCGIGPRIPLRCHRGRP